MSATFTVAADFVRPLRGVARCNRSSLRASLKGACMSNHTTKFVWSALGAAALATTVGLATNTSASAMSQADGQHHPYGCSVQLAVGTDGTISGTMTGCKDDPSLQWYINVDKVTKPKQTHLVNSLVGYTSTTPELTTAAITPEMLGGKCSATIQADARVGRHLVNNARDNHGKSSFVSKSLVTDINLSTGECAESPSPSTSSSPSTTTPSPTKSSTSSPTPTAPSKTPSPTTTQQASPSSSTSSQPAAVTPTGAVPQKVQTDSGRYNKQGNPLLPWLPLGLGIAVAVGAGFALKRRLNH